MSRTFLTVVLLCLLNELCAAPTAEEEIEEEPESTALSSLHLPGELTLSDSFVRAVGTAGVVVTGVAGLAAIVSYVLPMFGFRTCALFGTCDANFDAVAYNQNVAANSVYDQPGYTGYQYNTNTFRKRSLEYVGPILKALSAAYEKYGPKVPKNGNVVSAKAASK